MVHQELRIIEVKKTKAGDKVIVRWCRVAGVWWTYPAFLSAFCIHLLFINYCSRVIRGFRYVIKKPETKIILRWRHYAENIIIRQDVPVSYYRSNYVRSVCIDSRSFTQLYGVTRHIFVYIRQCSLNYFATTLREINVPCYMTCVVFWELTNLIFAVSNIRFHCP